MKDCVVVSVCCLTYNHAPYIRQCLDGMLAQKCDFKFEIVIHDDASTDGAEEIIREYERNYPNIIKPLYEKENQWIKGRRGSAVFNFPRAQGKYIALCEGDDYWIDPLKLQKQVDFLEANPDFAICFHPVKIRLENKNKIIADSVIPEVADSTDIYRLAEGNYIHTPSVVFRKSDSVIEAFLTLENIVAGDYVLHMLNAQYGKIKKLFDCMAVYRIHDGGVWSSKDPLYTYPCWMDLLDKLKGVIPDIKANRILDRQKARFATDLYLLYLKEGNKEKAMYYYKIALEVDSDSLFCLLGERIIQLENSITRMNKSKSYRLGRFLLKPLYTLSLLSDK